MCHLGADISKGCLHRECALKPWAEPGGEAKLNKTRQGEYTNAKDDLDEQPAWVENNRTNK